MHINLIPLEILIHWICKKNSGACKQWRQIWYNKTRSLKYTYVITLRPIKHFKNLQHLEIDFDALVVKDARYLKRMTKLQSLEFYNDSLTDDILKSLKNLTSLLYASQNVTDESIKRLTKLRSLSLRQKDGITHKSLDRLTNLTSVSLDGNTRPINRTLIWLPLLTDLHMNDNNMTIHTLKEFTNLTKLSMTNCPKLFDEGIKTLTKINHLSLIGMDYISDRSLKELKNLTRLEICDCDRIYDRTLQKMTKLQHFETCGKTQITMRSLKYLTNLKTLMFDNRDYFDHEKLSHLVNLTDLRLTNCSNKNIRQRDITGLTNLSNLVLDEATHIKMRNLKIYLPNLKRIDHSG
uniref:F-box domain-containing protein n=1 Tax=viral metagenome TaxID=1070528 RepID=A0A6C0C8S6_9ZZZZ